MPNRDVFYGAHPARSILSDQFLADVRGRAESQKYDGRKKKLNYEAAGARFILIVKSPHE